MALEFFSASGTATANSIFIPVANLSGLISTEIESGDSTAFKNASFVYSFLKKLRGTLSTVSYLATQATENYLGLSQVSSDSIASTGILRSTIAITTQFIADKASETLSILPLNGDSDGELAFTDIFAGAVKVAAAGSTGGAGVVIPSSDVELYGSPSYASLNLTADSRQLITSILTYLYHEIATVRVTGTTQSAIFAKAKSNAVVTIPATAYDPTTPTTGIDGNDLDWLFAASETLSFTVELMINDDETITPNVA